VGVARTSDLPSRSLVCGYFDFLVKDLKDPRRALAHAASGSNAAYRRGLLRQPSADECARGSIYMGQSNSIVGAA
jgi:hypothetical protein